MDLWGSQERVSSLNDVKIFLLEDILIPKTISALLIDKKI